MFFSLFLFYLKSVDYRLTNIGVFNSEVFSLKSEAVIAGLITCTGWIFLEITFSHLYPKGEINF